ncbi:hypothetical protein SFC23_17785 [Shouchella clausii]|uniref:hypothetical protein n=1 Tax=Shouchella clausii TaxID=79880 RepID=UPI003982FD60
MNSELNLTLNDTFNAISILLVFVTMLFSIRYPEIKEILDEPLQTDKPKALERQKIKVKRDLFSKWLPVVILNLIVVYTMTPLAFKTLVQSSLSLLNFDFIRTTFILIWFFIIVFSTSSIILLLKLCKKIKQCNIHLKIISAKSNSMKNCNMK